MDYFDGKIVWITGASSGIGRAIAVALARLDARLILSARSEDKLETLAGELKELEADIRLLPLDLTDLESLENRATEAIGMFGRIDMLFNNAGISQRSLLHETSFEVIRKLLDVNFTGGAALSTYLLPHMQKRRSGHIVAMSSLMGLFGTPLRGAYSAAKHAIHGFYGSLSAEAAQYGVSVTVVIPGWIRTDMSINALSGDGSLHGVVDRGHSKAKPADAYVKTILRAVSRRKFQKFIALNSKTRVAVLINRFFPALLRSVLKKINVT